jgi:hypothetical protein
MAASVSSIEDAMFLLHAMNSGSSEKSKCSGLKKYLAQVEFISNGYCGQNARFVA